MAEGDLKRNELAFLRTKEMVIGVGLDVMRLGNLCFLASGVCRT
jgi:hypothetical protein